MAELVTSRSQGTVPTVNHAATSGQYLTFVLAGEVYAVGILSSKEIIDFGDVTQVPMMPSFIVGVINLRGRVVPVIDLSARFGHGATPIVKRTAIIILEAVNFDRDGEESSQDIGVIVDAVNEVLEIDARDIEPPPAFGARIRADFVSGMAKHKGGFIVLLNVNRVLSVDEMVGLGQSLVGNAHSVPGHGT